MDTGAAAINVSDKGNGEHGPNPRFLPGSPGTGGNQAAFEQLVHAHDHAVLRLAFRITGSQSDAQDIYQEAFLKIYRKLGGFRFECSFTSWIYRIVTNLCLDHLRKTRNRRERSTDEVNKEGEEYDLLNQISDDRPAHNPEQQLLRRELSEHLSCALQTLTPRERMVFELKHFEGLKLRTVSEILNSSEGSVKTTLFRATQKLRSQLAAFHARPPARAQEPLGRFAHLI